MRPDETHDAATIPARPEYCSTGRCCCGRTRPESPPTQGHSPALREAGARVDMLLGGVARPLKEVPEIAMASQVFGRTPQRTARMRALGLLWRTRFGLRRQLPVHSVAVAGMALDTLEPRLPPHDGLFNASEVRDHAHIVFAVRGQFTEVAARPFNRGDALGGAGTDRGTRRSQTFTRCTILFRCGSHISISTPAGGRRGCMQ